jgi:hypothetical protein
MTGEFQRQAEGAIRQGSIDDTMPSGRAASRPKAFCGSDTKLTGIRPLRTASASARSGRGGARRGSGGGDPGQNQTAAASVFGVALVRRLIARGCARWMANRHSQAHSPTIHRTSRAREDWFPRAPRPRPAALGPGEARSGSSGGATVDTRRGASRLQGRGALAAQSSSTSVPIRRRSASRCGLPGARPRKASKSKSVLAPPDGTFA